MHLRQIWKEAAGVILVAPASDASTSFDVLTTAGTTATTTRSNIKSLVVPAGQVDYTDFSYDWWQLFERSGQYPQTLYKQLCCAAKHRPPIVTDNETLAQLRRWSCNEEDVVCADIALRLAAIRHLFVQTGILLAKSMSSDHEPLNMVELESLRQIIKDNPKKFIEMCADYRLLPDLCSLHEWCNWLTPACVGRHDRFDTIYYLCCLEQPVQSADTRPEQHWSTPRQLMDRQRADHYFLSPPQVYELSRLVNFNSISDLRVFAKRRQQEGCDRWLPVLTIYADGTVTALPGDDSYPESVELEASRPSRLYTQPLASVRHTSGRLNRLELRGSEVSVVVNVDMPFGHVRPCADPFTSARL